MVSVCGAPHEVQEECSHGRQSSLHRALRGAAYHVSTHSARTAPPNPDPQPPKREQASEALGGFIALANKNDEGNLRKLKKAWAALERSEANGRGGGNRCATVRGLLELERDSGIHGAGGVLADPSAAMAILWLRRSMDFMVGVQVGPPNSMLASRMLASSMLASSMLPSSMLASSMLASSMLAGRAREGVCRRRDAMHAWCDARACCACRPT